MLPLPIEVELFRGAYVQWDPLVPCELASVPCARLRFELFDKAAKYAIKQTLQTQSLCEVCLGVRRVRELFTIDPSSRRHVPDSVVPGYIRPPGLLVCEHCLRCLCFLTDHCQWYKQHSVVRALWFSHMEQEVRYCDGLLEEEEGKAAAVRPLTRTAKRVQQRLRKFHAEKSDAGQRLGTCCRLTPLHPPHSRKLSEDK